VRPRAHHLAELHREPPGARIRTPVSWRRARAWCKSPFIAASAASLLCLLAILAAWPAQAQVKAPSMVEEDLPAEEPAPSPKPAAAEPAAQKPPANPVDSKAPPAAVPAPVTNPVPGAPPGAPATGKPPTAVSGTPSSAPSPAPVTENLRRPIEPVKTSPAEILRLWQEQRKALREQDGATAHKAREAILAAKQDLAVENLTSFASAEVREAEKSLAARLGADALEHATFAVALAPDLADAHLALARANFFGSEGKSSAGISALWSAVRAGWREPHTARAIVADATAAGLAALFAAACAAILLLLVKRVRLYLHDFHHLPLVRAGTSVQAALLALALLAVPIAFQLGPFPALAIFALAVWLYLSFTERVVVTAALCSLVVLPMLTRMVAAEAVWTGTLAEQIYEIQHGEMREALVASLEAKAGADGQGVAPAARMALGLYHKRRGDLEAALRWYQRAAMGEDRSSELDVDRGNVLFLRGDLEGAKAAFLAATDRSGVQLSTLAAAHYNLYKVYLRLSALEQGDEARRRAQQEDGALVERYGSDEDFRANRYLIDVGVPQPQLEQLAVADGAPDALAEAIRARLAGAVPGNLWPAAPLGWMGLLWILALARKRIAPSVPCERCGRPACRRCDGQAKEICGQCVNVFLKRGLVDSRDRLRKEAQVRRHGRWVKAATRMLAVVGGGIGHLFAGDAIRGFLFTFALLFCAFVCWFWRGVLPPPPPSPYVVGAKLALAVPLGVFVYAAAVWDVFRRSKE